MSTNGDSGGGQVLPCAGQEAWGESSFLARLAGPDRVALLALAARRRVQRGEYVFEAGSPGHHTYFLEHGRINIYQLSPTGKAVLLWFCLPGEIFGLAEVCRGGGRQTYAEAVESSSVLAVTQQDFRQFLEIHSSTALLINDVLASRLRTLGDMLVNLVADDVHTRLIKLLTRLSALYGRRTGNENICLDVSLTHQEIADMIGTTRQSVTSLLNDLRRQSLLRIEKRRIHIAPALYQTLSVVDEETGGFPAEVGAVPD
jgi:CRP/FNR family transcriptional regulator